MNILFKNDKKLIKELQAGNKKAYTFLFKTYYNSLCVYCFSLTKNNDIAEDIVQSTLIKIWDNRKDLVIHTSLKSYLYKMVYNNFVNEYLKIKKKEEFLDKVRINTINATIEQDDSILNKKLLLIDNAIEELPSKCRTVFILNKKEGYSYEEISSILNISINTVENHVSNALSKIRKKLIPPPPPDTKSKTDTDIIVLVLVQYLWAIQNF